MIFLLFTIELQKRTTTFNVEMQHNFSGSYFVAAHIAMQKDRSAATIWDQPIISIENKNWIRRPE